MLEIYTAFTLVLYGLYICAFLGMLLWIYQIRKNTIVNTEQLQALNEKINNQNNIQLAQLGLLAGIADKLGVQASDINEIVSPFGIEYE